MKINKLKEWIRNKLIQFILLDEVKNEIKKSQQEETNKINNKIFNLDNTVRSRFDILRTSNYKNEEKIETLHNTVRNIVSVGADIKPHQIDGSSWAVVCIEGRYNIVKFINLKDADYRYILMYLKQFDSSRRVIDSPPFTMFEREFTFEEQKK